MFRDLQSSFCRISYVLPLLLNVHVLVPLVMCLQVMHRPGHVCISFLEALILESISSGVLFLSCFSLDLTSRCWGKASLQMSDVCNKFCGGGGWVVVGRGGARKFPTGGLMLPTRGLTILVPQP